MSESVMPVWALRRRGVALGLGLGLALAAAFGPVAQASPAFPALDRPALATHAPERQVLLAAAQAGQRIIASGERGLVVLSDDHGQTWRQARHVPVSVSLTALSFVDAQHGWAVGHGGFILHTSDGGETWSRQAEGVALAQAALAEAEQWLAQHPEDAAAQRALRAAQYLVADGADKPLLDVHFIDAQRGWVVGAYNLLLATTDGGATWRSLSTRLDNPRALHLNALAVRGQTLFIAGEQGLLYRSVDGGQSFVALDSPYQGSWFALALTEDGSVTVGGLRGHAFQSHDGGQSWQAIAGLPPVSIVSATAGPQGVQDAQGAQGTGLLLANQAGQVFRSQQGRAQPLSTPPMPPLNSLLALESQALLALGFGGAISIAPQSSGSGKSFGPSFGQ